MNEQKRRSLLDQRNLLRKEKSWYADEVLEIVDIGERGSKEHQEMLKEFWDTCRELQKVNRVLRAADSGGEPEQ